MTVFLYMLAFLLVADLLAFAYIIILFHRHRKEPEAELALKPAAPDIEELAELYGEDMIKMDGYDDCVIGVCERFGQEPFILYDMDKVLQRHVDDGMDYGEAREFLEYNQLGIYAGQKTWGFLSKI